MSATETDQKISAPVQESAPPVSGPRAVHAQVYWVAAGHLMLDSYTGSLSVYLPILLPKFQLSMTLGAALLMAYSLLASLGQLPFGFLSDRFPRFKFPVWGLLVTGVLISAIAWAPAYWVVLLLLCVAGLSTAAFHPQSAAIAGEAAGRSRAFSMAVFMTAGRTGYAVGPLMAAPVAAYFGPDYLLLTALPALAIALAVRSRWEPVQAHQPWTGFEEFLKPFRRNFRPLALLWIVEALRTGVMVGLSSFLPLLMIQKGYGLVPAGASVSTFIGAGAVGSLIGGRWADRVGRRRILLVTMVSSIPLSYGFLWTRGPFLWIFLAALGMVAIATLGVTIALAQELVPESASTASSLMMGVTWTVGSAGILYIGFLADRVGLPTAIALLFLAWIPAAAAAWLLPSTTEKP